MSFIPTKLLRFTMNGLTPFATWAGSGPWVGYPYQWTTTLTITPQPHGSPDTPTPYFYDGNDVAVGDYILTSGGQGRILKIAVINSKTAGTVSCVVEDDGQQNTLQDVTASGEGGIPPGEGILFSVKNGLPILHPLPDALFGVVPPYFSADIIARFMNNPAHDNYLLARENHTGTQTASTISDFNSAVVAAAPPTTDASLLTTGMLPDARLSSNIARTADVTSAVAAVVGAAPESLNTLQELSTALSNDANFATTVTNLIATKAPIASPTFTGTVSGITKDMVGLGNVSNLAPADFPVSAATQTALDGKAAAAHVHGNISNTGAIGSTSGQIVVTGAAGVLTVAASISSAQVSGLGALATLSSVNTTQIVDAAVTVAKLSATGTPSSATYLDGSGAWSSPVSGLASVATTGSYNDLSNKPTIPAAYTLPNATASTLGGVIVGAGLSVSSGTVSVITYSVQSDTVSNVSYIGRAVSGSATSASVWTIRRTTVAAAGTVTTATATNVKWDDRLTASYS